MSRIAHEVSRRMTPGYAKERAREMARERMDRARDRAVESSWLAPMVGAGIGALVAKALQSRAQERRWDRQEGWSADDRRGRWELEGGRYGYGGDLAAAPYSAAEPRDRDVSTHASWSGDGEEGGGIRDRASEAASQAGARLSGMAEGARHRAEDAKERLQGAAASMRERMPDRERLRASARDDTGLWALGALALGALFGFALPETERERSMLEPARRKARELGREAADRAMEKGAEAMEQATEKVRASGERGEPKREGQDESSAIVPPSGPPAPLH